MLKRIALYFRSLKTAPFKARIISGRSSIPLQKPRALALGASFFILAWFLFIGRAFAWEIDDLQANIEINKDSSIVVTEKILANFSDQAKHGIFRNIPVQYRDETGKSINLSLQILGITDERGSPWEYEERYSGIYKVLKIGSPYKTYNTKKLFVIKYRVTGALLYLANHDELYWNAVGTEWDAPINNVQINVRLPEPVGQEQLMTAAYSGKYGSRASNVQTRILADGSIIFTGSRYMPYEGLTIAVGWPKGIAEEVKTPYAYTESAQPAYGGYAQRGPGPGIIYIVILIPILVFLAMFAFWWAYGKDPQLRKSIVVEYEPPEGLSPAEMGAVIDDKVSIRDISSTIIDLAVRGYLRIESKEGAFFKKSYSFIKLKEFSEDKSLNFFEREILNGIFGQAHINEKVSLHELENKFYEKLEFIKNDIFDNLIEKKIYLKNPEKVVHLYRVPAIIFAVLAFICLFYLRSPLLGVSFGLSALIVFIYAKYMPAKTPKGADVLGKVLGFEEFLRRADKDKIQFEERQNIFERMLPFAVCLGISNQWARIFADIYKQPPEWFAGDYRGVFVMDYFLHDLNGAMSSMNTTLTSVPRSVSSGGGFGGGGFGGGGFGGGGGGSW